MQIKFVQGIKSKKSSVPNKINWIRVFCLLKVSFLSPLGKDETASTKLRTQLAGCKIKQCHRVNPLSK
jgi:hypothetical protein